VYSKAHKSIKFKNLSLFKFNKKLQKISRFTDKLLTPLLVKLILLLLLLFNGINGLPKL
jgi:hypothetical protein